jgi:hypothetical protein
MLRAMTTATVPTAARRGTAARTWRQLLVWLHVVSSVSWMSQAAALAVLIGTSAAAPPGELKVAAVLAAELLDGTVLVFSANVAAFTGFALAATTTWGFFHHWWVATKFMVTVGQLYLGIFVLSGRLHEAADAAAAGLGGPTMAMAAAAALMAGAFAAQVWVSVAKPWGRTPLARRAPRPPAAPAWLLAAAVLVPVTDVVLGVAVFGHPLPALSLTVLAIALVARRRR